MTRLTLEQRIIKRRLRRERQAAIERNREVRKIVKDYKLSVRARNELARYRLRLLKRKLREKRWLLHAQNYGSHVNYVNQSLLSQEIDVNGNITNSYSESNQFITSQWHDRQGHSANPIKPLEGYPGTKWRNPSNYTRFDYKVSYTPQRFVYRDSEGRPRFIEDGLPLEDGSFFGPHLYFGPVLITDSNLYDRAITECLLKIQDQKVNIGENLATAMDTIRLLSSSASDLARIVYYARRGQWGKLHKVLGLTGKPLGAGLSAANRWLEYQFGWKPLMSDIHSAAELLKDGFRKKAILFSATRTTKVREIIERDYPLSWWPHASGSSNLSCRVKIYSSVSDETASKLSQLGLIDPLGVAWELVPFSFVLDWLYPVGNFLQALHAADGLKFVGGTVTWRVDCQIDVKWRRPHITSLVCEDFGTAKFETKAIFRNILTAFPTPNLYSKSPFSSTHLLDALALIAGAIKR